MTLNLTSFQYLVAVLSQSLLKYYSELTQACCCKHAPACRQACLIQSYPQHRKVRMCLYLREEKEMGQSVIEAPQPCGAQNTLAFPLLWYLCSCLHTSSVDSIILLYSSNHTTIHILLHPHTFPLLPPRVPPTLAHKY